MAYLTVVYSSEVDVFIDRARSGKTGETLDVGAGHHDIAIGDEASSICPPVQEVEISEAEHTVVTPLIVTFPKDG